MATFESECEAGQHAGAGAVDGVLASVLDLGKFRTAPVPAELGT